MFIDGPLATLEAATAIENEVDRVDIFYGFGIRSMGIVYSEANALGAGLREKGDGGLTDLGRQVVERMNKLGMIVDVSHCGDQTSRTSGRPDHRSGGCDADQDRASERHLRGDVNRGLRRAIMGG